MKADGELVIGRVIADGTVDGRRIREARSWLVGWRGSVGSDLDPGVAKVGIRETVSKFIDGRFVKT